MRGFFDYIFFKQKKVKKKLKISWGQASRSGLIRGHDIRAKKKGDRLLFMIFCLQIETVHFLTEKVACPLFLFFSRWQGLTPTYFYLREIGNYVR